MHTTLRVFLATALTAALLAACERGDPHQPPPLGTARPAESAPDPSSMASGPDTRTMGAGAFPMQCQAVPDEVLRRLNALRAAGQRCGGRSMPPAPPLKWDPSLLSAAQSHALDMAKRNYFDHRSPEGTSLAQRATASRYRWKSVGENIAGGDTSVAGVMESWRRSPEHCANMLERDFDDVAVACVQQPGTEWGTYWTMVLGRKL